MSIIPRPFTTCPLVKRSLADRDRFLANRDYLDMMRARVLAAEIDLLHTLGFDFGVVHPYPYLLKARAQPAISAARLPLPLLPPRLL